MGRLRAIASRAALWKIGGEDEKGARMSGRPKKGKLLIAALIGAAFTLSACATVKGLGRDIQSVGEAGSDAINN